jgi:AAA15 family ATPase/GTPase
MEITNRRTLKQLTDTKLKELIKDGINEIAISGFKSIYNEKKIEIRPLTILAGTNSSGKSSFMQSLLLMKQTLEQNYDPGVFLLNGPNVKFTESHQLLFDNGKGLSTNVFSVGIKVGNQNELKIFYKKSKPGFRIEKMETYLDGKKQEFTEGKMDEELIEYISNNSLYSSFTKNFSDASTHFLVRRERCFLNPVIEKKFGENEKTEARVGLELTSTKKIANEISRIIHLPGLRGIPERNYPTTGVDSTFDEFLPGTFVKYVASIITHWQELSPKLILSLEENLKKIGLTNKVKTRLLNDTEVGMYVGKSIDGSKDDLVSIADVGLGVSQTLPILVALLFARKGQVVYIEQPEIHLHPRAQYELAKIIADAANRGVKVVVETHSSLFIRGIQTAVAGGYINKELIKLHWFKRDKNTGMTDVTSNDLDENGSFGDWPEDFDEISIMADREYLKAVEKRMWDED